MLDVVIIALGVPNAACLVLHVRTTSTTARPRRRHPFHPLRAAMAQTKITITKAKPNETNRNDIIMAKPKNILRWSVYVYHVLYIEPRVYIYSHTQGISTNLT